MKKKYTFTQKKLYLALTINTLMLTILVTAISAKKQNPNTSAVETTFTPINNFGGPIDEVFKEAERKNQNIFISTYSSQCTGCYANIKKALNVKEVAEYYDKNFISYQLNLDDFQSAYIVELFNLNSSNNGTTQQILFFSPDKSIISVVNVSPNPTPNELIQYAQNAINQKNTACNERQLNLLKEQYPTQKTEPAFVEELCLQTKACNPYQVPDWINNEMSKLTTTEQIRENLEFIYNFSYDVESFANHYFIKYIDFFKQVKQSEIVNQKIKQDAYNTVIVATQKKDPILLQKAIEKIDNCVVPESNKFNFMLTLQYYAKMQDWNNYLNEAIKFLNKKGGTATKLAENSKFSTYLAYTFHQCVGNSHTEKNKLEFALNLIDQAISIDNEPDSYYVKALLLRRTGKTAQAAIIAKQGVELLAYKSAVFSEELKNFE